MFLTARSSHTNATQLSVIALESLWWKSLLCSAILRCSLATLALAFSQFFEPVWVLWSYCFFERLCWNLRSLFAWILIHLGFGMVTDSSRFPKTPKSFRPRSTEAISLALINVGNTGLSITLSILSEIRYEPSDSLLTVAALIDTPCGWISVNVFPFGRINLIFPIFGSLTCGIPPIIFSSMLLFVKFVVKLLTFGFVLEAYFGNPDNPLKNLLYASSTFRQAFS